MCATKYVFKKDSSWAVPLKVCGFGWANARFCSLNYALKLMVWKRGVAGLTVLMGMSEVNFP